MGRRPRPPRSCALALTRPWGRRSAIAAEAFTDAMAATEPGMTELALEARLEFGCKVRGATHLAYPPIVAGGPRGAVIHYIQNDSVRRNGGQRGRGGGGDGDSEEV